MTQKTQKEQSNTPAALRARKRRARIKREAKAKAKAKAVPKPPKSALPSEPTVQHIGRPKKDGPGRPRDPYEERWVVRHNKPQMKDWTAAATAAGLRLQDWVRNALDVASGRAKAAA